MDQKYQAQISLPNFGIKAQEKLGKAEVVIVGSGGLGCPAILSLASAGLGKLKIIDGDVVKLSNLPRQSIYSESDLGKSKVEVVRKEIESNYPDTKLTVYDNFLVEENCEILLSGAELIIDCTDDFQSRYLLDDYCYEHKIPLIYAGVHQYQGQLSVFHYKGAYSYRDCFPESEFKDGNSCSETGVIGTLTSVLGSWQANEAIKIITGIGKVCSGTMLHFDMANNEVSSFKLNKREEPTLKTLKTADFQITELAFYEQLNGLSGDGLLIWIRNGWDDAIEPPFAVDLVLDLEELENKLTAFIRYNRILIICQKGIKSAAAAHYLIRKLPEKKVFSLKGGYQKMSVTNLNLENE